MLKESYKTTFFERTSTGAIPGNLKNKIPKYK